MLSLAKNVTEILKGGWRVFKSYKKAEQPPHVTSAVPLHKQTVGFSSVGKVVGLSAYNYDLGSFKTVFLVI